jgi:hypothetical protein
MQSCLSVKPKLFAFLKKMQYKGKFPIVSFIKIKSLYDEKVKKIEIECTL